MLSTFQKDHSPGPDGWTVEFYLDFFDILAEDLLCVVEEVRLRRKVLVNINSTFVALIPKVDCPGTFDEFRPISLCNYLFKIISKVLAVGLKPLLSNYISVEQFNFLEDRQIHEAIGSAQEGLQSIKLSNDPAVVIKLDLSKAYDKLSWFYLRLLLLHLGFSLAIVK